MYKEMSLLRNYRKTSKISAYHTSSLFHETECSTASSSNNYGLDPKQINFAGVATKLNHENLANRQNKFIKYGIDLEIFCNNLTVEYTPPSPGKSQYRNRIRRKERSDGKAKERV